MNRDVIEKRADNVQTATMNREDPQKKNWKKGLMMNVWLLILNFVPAKRYPQRNILIGKARDLEILPSNNWLI
ncbi:hypothetical protein [Lacrimispora sp.]|uniref:hypothetical protein n=1 Tax=Lacrimispora sp. TaxID=2719234 RepID=UPI0039E41FB7